MKRIMGAEYSRDLSEKVFIAQSRFTEMGFKQGGHAGYGLRRLALKACGTPRTILGYGESKVAVTDRVILVWGPELPAAARGHIGHRRRHARSRQIRLREQFPGCGIEGEEHAVDGKAGKNHPAPRRHRTATAGYAHRDRQTGAHPEWATVSAGS